MDINVLLRTISDLLLGWPLILYVFTVSLICTLAFKCIQFRYFIQAWKYILFPQPQSITTKSENQNKKDMTPIQAFVNALSISLGNGSIAGMATAIYAGGPGAAFWLLVIGMFLMAVRFAEIYLSIFFSASISHMRLGGPMIYLKKVAGGSFLSGLYALLCLLFAFTVGNAMQTNSIRISLVETWAISPVIIAAILLFFIFYVLYGGAARIIYFSDKIVPIKVITFFVSAFILLAYHYQTLGSALKLIAVSAFQPTALAGGVIGFSLQQAMRFGISRAITATEAGVGTAGVLFGSTGSKEAVKDSLTAILSTFLGIIVCFLVGLCIVASGVWQSGLTSTALTIASFNTVFGYFGGWIVSFLSITFGVGVLVAYSYIAREVWLYLTNGRFELIFILMFSAIAFAGALIDVHVVWLMTELVVAFMLYINLYGIMYLLPIIRRGVYDFMQKNR